MGSPAPTTTSSPLSLWANQTLACSAAGCAAGAIQGFLGRGGGLPTPVLVTAYGVNALALGGIFFALRGAAVAALPGGAAASGDRRWASAGAGALTGLGAWGVAGGGLRRAPAGGALLGALALAGQVAFDALEAARQGEGAVAAGSGRVAGAQQQQQQQQPAAAGASGSAGGAPQPPAPEAAQWAPLPWLPLNMSPAGADAARLAKEQRRLVEVEQLLGLASPAVHPRALELAARERAALRALGEEAGGAAAAAKQ
jgi:hypothetical protein